jgi:hypothetical protein
MNKISALVLFVAVSLTSAFAVKAQTAETIWIQTSTLAYKIKETVTVTINGVSATPIQGFTAQIRYDPACLQPLNGTSPIPGMNGLAVPQASGLADVSFASTTPQIANGVLAEVRFTALEDCQTSLNLETAALVMRNESGFAVPITGVNINQNAIVLNIDSAVGSPQPAASGESVLPLVPTIFPEKHVNWWVVGLLVLAGVSFPIVIGLYILKGPANQ